MGLTPVQALENMVGRCPTPAVESFARAMMQGQLLGVSIGQILRSLAIEMRKRRRAHGRAAGAEGADQDALPARLHDLPGPVRRHPRAGGRLRSSTRSTADERPDDSRVRARRRARARVRVAARPSAAARELLPTGTAARARRRGLRSSLVVGELRRASACSGQALLGAVFCPTLVLLAAIDLKHRLLPNEIILPASLAVGLIVAASASGRLPRRTSQPAPRSAASSSSSAPIFAGSIGMGDAKLGFLLGLALGSKTLGAALIAFAGLLVAALYVLGHARHLRPQGRDSLRAVPRPRRDPGLLPRLRS